MQGYLVKIQTLFWMNKKIIWMNHFPKVLSSWESRIWTFWALGASFYAKLEGWAIVKKWTITLLCGFGGWEDIK